MKNNRVITVAVLVGVTIAAVTFLGAARMSGDDAGSAKDGQKILGPVKSTKGVVFFGTGSIDNGVGLLPLYPEAMGRELCKVKKVLVSEGQQVVKGQKLIELDTELPDFDVAVARAAYDQAQGALKEADAALHAADQMMQGHQVAIQVMEKQVLSKKAELEAAKRELEEKKRLSELFNASKADVEIAQKKLDAATKAFEGEEIRLEGLKAITPISKKETAQASVAQARAAVAKQKTMFDKAVYGLRLMTLTAPDDGKIVRCEAAEGLTYGPQTRQPAVWFQPKGTLIVRAEVDQEFASRVAAARMPSFTTTATPA